MDAATLHEREAAWLAEGFHPWPEDGRFASGGFVPANARIFVREESRPEGAPQLRFRVQVEARHCNGSGRAHGGFIATLADVWLAYSLARQLPTAARFVTTSLQIDYLRAVHPGDQLESAIDWLKPGARLGHAAGRILAGDKAVAAMRGVFAML